MNFTEKNLQEVLVQRRSLQEDSRDSWIAAVGRQVGIDDIVTVSQFNMLSILWNIFICGYIYLLLLIFV